ncbi:MAG: cysteine--tRNA ligase, partial [Clostridia bacterium]|nr:cysteine--tRNA ligase [Clostridia bacterium]
YVRNHTDVDDKIIANANKIGMDQIEYAHKYIDRINEDLANLGIRQADYEPKASETIQDIIEFIKDLIDKGYAYQSEVNGDVYFDVLKFPEYGKLSNRDVEEQLDGVRKDILEGKHDNRDFALWKSAKEGEVSWDSPWGKGRPGWHIECSVMSKKYIGEEIDIHAGGEDLIFPHHENEIAQSEAANGKLFAKYWMHNGFLNIDNKKMSKSLGNFFTVREIGEKYPLQVIRFFMLSSHYRGPINFSEELVASAKTGLDRILTAVDNLEYLYNNATVESITEEEKASLDSFIEYNKKFDVAMEDDFNTADAISVVFEMVRLANSVVSSSNSKEFIESVKGTIEVLCGVLGIETTKEEELLDEDIEKLIEERQQARKDRNFARADEIRNSLLEKGIILEDTREGVKWKKA